jgi:hypothetical protein
LNIYIYGNASFKKNIHKILDRSNMRFKLEDGKIEDIEYLYELEELIEKDSSEIFIIDQNKVLQDDIWTKVFKFLKPKDGIKKSFLDHHGLGDISIRSYDDLPIYIEKRLEAMEKAKPKPHEIMYIDQMLEDDTIEALKRSSLTN